MIRNSSILRIVSLLVIGLSSLAAGCGERRGHVHDRRYVVDRDRHHDRYDDRRREQYDGRGDGRRDYDRYDRR